jgi:ABC-2 type transport system permease protein
MHKAFLVAKHEYLKMVRRRSFLLGTLGVPLLIVGVMVISILIVEGRGNKAPLGYVDDSGLLNPNVQIPGAAASADAEAAAENERVEIRPYPNEATARAALEANEIQAYYVVPEDYMATGRLEFYYWDDTPGVSVRSDFASFLRANLVSGLPEPVARRAFDGIHLLMRSADGSRQASENNVIPLILPFFAGLFFLIAAMNSAQYLLRAVSDEKENRTMEILVTSLMPGQLIGGKAVGLIAVALTQLLIWTVAIVVGLTIGGRFFAELRNIPVPWDLVLVSLLYFIPSFTLIAGLEIAIGSTVTEAQEGQQVAGILNLLFTCPYFLVMPVFMNPNSPLSVFLSLFPTTAYITITMRWGVSLIPTWQLVLSLALLVSAALFSIWAAARIFRVGMLSYGQRLSLRAALAAIRGR